MARTRKLEVTFSVVFTLCELASLGRAAPIQNPGQWLIPPFNHGVDPNNPTWDPNQGGANSQGGKAGSNCKVTGERLPTMDAGIHAGTTDANRSHCRVGVA